MDEKEIVQFYRDGFLPFYQARGKDRINFTKEAEKYFSTVCHLLTTLSVGMIAFLGIVKDEIFSQIDRKLVMLPFIGLTLAIICAVILFCLLAFHNKRYADSAVKDESEVFKKWSEGKYDDVKKKIDKETKEFSEREGGDWQRSTITFGIAAIILFIISIVLIICFIFIGTLDKARLSGGGGFDSIQKVEFMEPKQPPYSKDIKVESEETTHEDYKYEEGKVTDSGVKIY